MNISCIRKSNQIILSLIFVVITSCTFAQQDKEGDIQSEEIYDGEKLFKLNCASCHHPVKESTGPSLQGAKQRWEDDGQGQYIYEWVVNSVALASSGKSSRASDLINTKPDIMTPQPLSNGEIDAIFTYVDKYKAPASVAGNSENASDVEEESSAYWWWILAGLLVIVIFSTLGSRRQLSHLVAKQEGKEIDPNQSIGDKIREWVIRNWFVTVVIFVVILIAGGVDLFTRLYQVGVFEDYQPSQPIAYSHKLHAGDLGIDCKYCHHSAEKSKHAGIPSLNVCMNCHKTVHEGKLTGKEEIAKIHAAAGFELLPAPRYKLDKDSNRIEDPIVWNKAHNLPDHVFFSHAQNQCVTQCYTSKLALNETFTCKGVIFANKKWDCL